MNANLYNGTLHIFACEVVPRVTYSKKHGCCRFPLNRMKLVKPLACAALIYNSELFIEQLA